MVSENTAPASMLNDVMEPSPLLSDENVGLSPQQQRLWQLASENPACRIRCVVEIQGALDPDRLRRAVQQVTASYAILRMGFVHRPSSPIPLPVSDGSAAWEEDLDLASLPKAEQESCFDRIWAAQAGS